MAKRILYLGILFTLFWLTACDYNSGKNSYIKEKINSLYKDAHSEYEKGEYVKCVVSLLEAEECALSVNDKYYLGLIYNSLRVVYSNTYNMEYALKYAEQSYNSFLQSDSMRLAEYALLDLGIAYINAGEYSKGKRILDNLKNENEYYDNVVNDSVFSLLNSEVLVLMGEYQKAKDLITSFFGQSIPLNARNYKDLALCYKYLAMPDSAIYYLNESLNRIDDDKLLEHRVNYEIALIEKDYKKSSMCLQNMMMCQDSLIRNAMKSGVLNAIEVYKDNHNQVLWMRAEREKWIYNCLFAVIVILFAVIVVFLYRKYNTLVIQKNSELMEVRESMNDILNQLNEKKYEISDTQLLVKKLFGQKFEIINNLCDTYFECQNTQREKNTIYREAISLINSFSEENTLQDLENIVNECNDDVVRRIRVQIPQLNEKEMSLLIYLYCGFSSRTVCLLMGDKLENYYNKKSRLKNKILKSNAVDKDEFVQLMCI